jgi:hypothetical protein
MDKAATHSNPKEGIETALQEGSKQLKEKVISASHEAKTRTQGVIQASKARVAEGLRDVASVLHKTNEELHSNKLSPVAQYGEKLEHWSQDLADYVQTASSRNLLHDAENFALRQPALFLGSAVVMGLAAARFLKSSPSKSSHREVSHEYHP